ncbi:MAG: zinc ribbon domain-containing protein [Candidatus Competibacterales bacterium]|nr:zinc ribbon domain-containing protein [Candidatus Competibacterales bacterium]
MPFYEYRCDQCGHELEAMQKLADPPLTDCPDCGESRLRRLISAVGFRLKGGGWYETDFKTGDKRNLVESGDKAGKQGGKDKADAKTDSKTDGKTQSTKPKTENASKPGSGSGKTTAA